MDLGIMFEKGNAIIVGVGLFYSEALVTSVSHHPGNVIANAEQGDLIFVEAVHFLIGEEVAEFPFAFAAKREEIVAWLPMAEGYGEGEFVFGDDEGVAVGGLLDAVSGGVAGYGKVLQQLLKILVVARF